MPDSVEALQFLQTMRFLCFDSNATDEKLLRENAPLSYQNEPFAQANVFF